MEKRNVLLFIHIIVPALVMFVLAYSAFLSPNDLYTMGFILNSLVIYFPLLFLLQGVVCALLRANLFLSLGVSLIAFIIVVFVWLNSSAAIYLILYISVWLIGYGITLGINKVLKK